MKENLNLNLDQKKKDQEQKVQKKKTNLSPNQVQQNQKVSLILPQKQVVLPQVRSQEVVVDLSVTKKLAQGRSLVISLCILEKKNLKTQK